MLYNLEPIISKCLRDAMLFLVILMKKLFFLRIMYWLCVVLSVNYKYIFFFEVYYNWNSLYTISYQYLFYKHLLCVVRNYNNKKTKNNFYVEPIQKLSLLDNMSNQYGMLDIKKQIKHFLIKRKHKKLVH